MISLRHAIRIALIAVAAIAVAALPVGTYAAARADTGSFPIEDHFVDPGASDACGFPVSVDLVGIARFQVRFDADGNPIDLALHISRTGTLSGNGVTLSEFDRINMFVDLRTGGQTEIGIEFRVSPVGGSPVAFDRGRLLFDADGNVTFVAGPHPALDGDFELLCDALGA
jgi:hypothetical protein